MKTSVHTTVEHIIFILGTAWLSVLIASKLEWEVLQRVRDMGKPFNCALCLGMWLGTLVGLFTLPIWFVPFAGFTTSAIAVLLERNTRDII